MKTEIKEIVSKDKEVFTQIHEKSRGISEIIEVEAIELKKKLNL